MPTTDELLADFNINARKKAEKLITAKDVHVEDEANHVYRSRGGQYRTQLYAGITAPVQASCTCPHGKNNASAVCYHAAAAILLAEHEGNLPKAVESGQDPEDQMDTQTTAEGDFDEDDEYGPDGIEDNPYYDSDDHPERSGSDGNG